MYYIRREKFIEAISKRVIKNLNLQNAFNALEKVYPGKWDYNITIDENLWGTTSKYMNNVDLNGNFDEDDEYIPKFTNNILDVINNRNMRVYVEFIIYFPEIIINNGRRKHNIKDLYVKIYQGVGITSTDYVGFHLTGIRSSLTTQEINADYAHSHLNGIGYKFYNFCLGSGPLSSLEYSFNLNSSTEDWQYLLTLINDYVRWESISGRPYRRIENIGTSDELTPIPQYIIAQILKDFKFKNISCKIDDSGITVIPTDELEKEIVEKLFETHYKIYLCYKNNNGEYIKKDECVRTERQNKLIGNTILTFKGEEIKFKIINSKHEYNDEFQINAPYPKLTEAICNHYSKRITEAYIRRSAVTEENPVEDTSTSIRGDKIFML